MQSKGQLLIVIILFTRCTLNRDSRLCRNQCIRKLFPIPVKIPVNTILDLNTTEKQVVHTKESRGNSARNYDDSRRLCWWEPGKCQRYLKRCQDHRAQRLLLNSSKSYWLANRSAIPGMSHFWGCNCFLSAAATWSTGQKDPALQRENASCIFVWLFTSVHTRGIEYFSLQILARSHREDRLFSEVHREKGQEPTGWSKGTIVWELGRKSFLKSVDKPWVRLLQPRLQKIHLRRSSGLHGKRSCAILS